MTVNGEVKRVSTATTAGHVVTGGSGNTSVVRTSNSNPGTAVMVGTVTTAPNATEYVEEIVEAEGVVMAATHDEPLTKRPRMDGDGPHFEDE